MSEMNQWDDKQGFSIFDLIAFVVSWKSIFFISILISLTCAAIYSFLSKRTLEYEFVLDTVAENHPVTKTQDLTKRAVVSMFSKANLCQSFSDDFFSTLELLSKENNLVGTGAKKSLAYFTQQYSDSNITDLKKSRFASYLNTSLLDVLRSEKPNKNKVFYYLNNGENTNWVFSLRIPDKDMTFPIVKATTTALRNMTRNYNESEMDRIQSTHQKEVEIIQKKLDENRDHLLEFQQGFWTEKTKLQFDFFSMSSKINKIYKSIPPASRNSDSSKISEDQAMISVDTEFGLKEINTERIIRRIADIQESGVINDATIKVFIDEISAIEAKRNALLLRYDLFKSNLETNKKTFSVALANSITPPRFEEFGLAGSAFNETLLTQQIQSNQTQSTFRVLLIYSFALIFGLLMAFVIASFFGFRHQFKESISNSRFNRYKTDKALQS